MDKQWTPTTIPTRVTQFYKVGTSEQSQYTKLALAWRVVHGATDVLEYLLINGQVKSCVWPSAGDGTHIRVEQFINGAWVQE